MKEIFDSEMTEYIVLKEFIEKIDWQLLKEQKLGLLDTLRQGDYNDLIPSEALMGILHLIDALQGTAVEAGIRSKEEEFNLTEE